LINFELAEPVLQQAEFQSEVPLPVLDSLWPERPVLLAVSLP